MLDLIKPKLVYLDLPLFMALLSDLFPGVELPQSDGGSLRRAIEAEIRDANLQVVSEYIVKIIQVFDCKVARHGNMIVGKTGSGKTEAWKCLQRALARLKKEEPDDERWGGPGWGVGGQGEGASVWDKAQRQGGMLRAAFAILFHNLRT